MRSVPRRDHLPDGPEASQRSSRENRSLHRHSLQGVEQGGQKPRTYRRQARKVYLSTAKAKRVGERKRRKVIGKQLRYLKRNLGHVDRLLAEGAFLSGLSAYPYKCLLVIHTLYEQQREMYKEGRYRVDHRIVSISQPHVCPIMRGKAGARVEFGAKISAGCADGFVHLDRLSGESFNESGDFIDQVEAYRSRSGSYPESVHVDKNFDFEIPPFCWTPKELRFLMVTLSFLPSRSQSFFFAGLCEAEESSAEEPLSVG